MSVSIDCTRKYKKDQYFDTVKNIGCVHAKIYKQLPENTHPGTKSDFKFVLI